MQIKTSKALQLFCYLSILQIWVILQILTLVKPKTYFEMENLKKLLTFEEKVLNLLKYKDEVAEKIDLLQKAFIGFNDNNKTLDDKLTEEFIELQSEEVHVKKEVQSSQHPT